MIRYDTGRLGLLFLFKCTGSVFPRAVLAALPNAIVAVLLHTYLRPEPDEVGFMSMNGVSLLWSGYTSVLSFLLVFRTNQAYTRFWEAATLINQVRGEWFNAISSLFAFCNHKEESKDQVSDFQHVLVRLASMLYCSALQQVCNMKNDCFEIIECAGMDEESLDFMHTSSDRCEVLVQWIQRLIVEADEKGTLKIAAPLLTRAFQELSHGIVRLNCVRKIVDIPFPFPYAQMITCMLLVHWVATPLMASQAIDSRSVACAVSFLVTFVLWCLVYIAMEIDQPFGEDPNDLPLHEMQKDFNRSLLTLMQPLAQKPPAYAAGVAKRTSVFSSGESSLYGEMRTTVALMEREWTTRSQSLRQTPRVGGRETRPWQDMLRPRRGRGSRASTESHLEVVPTELVDVSPMTKEISADSSPGALGIRGPSTLEVSRGAGLAAAPLTPVSHHGSSSARRRSRSASESTAKTEGMTEQRPQERFHAPGACNTPESPPTWAAPASELQELEGQGPRERPQSPAGGPQTLFIA